MGPTYEGTAEEDTGHDQNSLKRPVWTPRSCRLSFEVPGNTVAANKLVAQPFPIHVSVRNDPRNNDNVRWLLKDEEKIFFKF